MTMPLKFNEQKIGLVGFLILVALTVITGISVYVVMQHQAEYTLSKNLEVSLKDNKDLFSSQIAQRLDDTQMIATRPFIADNLSRLDRAQSRKDLKRVADSFVLQGLRGVAFYDAKGSEVARAGRFLQSQTPRMPVDATRSAFLSWDKKFLLHVHADIKDQQQRRIGSVVIEADLKLPDQALADLASTGRTAEFALCSPLQGDPQGMDCFLKNASGWKSQRLPRIMTEHALPMNYALEGKAGIIHAKDYRGVKVVAAYTHLSRFDLGAVLKIDQSELYSPVTAQLKYISLLLVALVMLGGLLQYWMLAPQARRLNASRLALKNENDKYLALLHNASDGIYILDTNGNIIEFSDSFCGMLGYTRNEMIGMNVLQWDADLELSKAEITAALYKQYAQYKRIQFEGHHRRKDGTVFDVEISTFPLLLGDKPVLFNSSRDITERRQAESLIRMQSDALNSSTNGVAIADASDPELPLLYVNPAFEKITGYPASELLGKNCRFLQGKDRDQPELAEIRACLKEGRTGKATLRNYRKDGTLFWNRLNISPIFDKTGKLVQFLGIINDITEQKHADDHLKLISGVFEHADEGILITDKNGTILEANTACSHITGYSREEMLGKNPRILHSGRQDRQFYETMWREVTVNGYWSGEVWNKRKNGEIYPERLTLSAVKNEEGEIMRFIALFSDISGIKSHQQQLERLAHHDALTGLPNRTLLNDRFEMALAQVKRSGEKLAVCFMDLDGFKPVNDNFGHEVGDILLIEVAQRMLSISRSTDTVARLGGDEFELIFTDISGMTECEQMLSRVMDTVNQPFNIDGHEIRISASIGVAFYPDDDTDGESLMRHADQAMYVAKQSGRGRFHFFDAASG